MDERAKKRIDELKSDAASGGYRINPDDDFVEGLVEGMLVNKDRYGIESCPCRLLTGNPEDNKDIICPCDYRDEDLAEYGACFCALYVTGDENSQRQVPDRRPQGKEKNKETESSLPSSLPYPVWRCSVCGYLCAANNPPRVCPICKAQERFERFI